MANTELRFISRFYRPVPEILAPVNVVSVLAPADENLFLEGCKAFSVVAVSDTESLHR